MNGHTAHPVEASDTLFAVMAEPTRDDVDALVGPATPHFAYQIRARLHASSKADEGPRESADRIGWDEIPSSARADDPLPRRPE